MALLMFVQGCCERALELFVGLYGIERFLKFVGLNSGALLLK